MMFCKLIVFIFMLNVTLVAKGSNCAITNSCSYDGFGAQFQRVIWTVAYAELNNKKFVYTPFKTMEHNYNGDPLFLEKKEKLINFIGNFKINDGSIAQLESNISLYHDFFDAHLDLFSKSSSLKKIREVFRSNKSKSEYFALGNLHIAVHVRRPNPHDNRIDGANTPDSTYLYVIESLRKQYADRNPLFHIYSQGQLMDFQQSYGAEDVVLHLNGSVEETFAAMVFADVLVTSASSFSYVAGILSEGVVYYLPFWHPPLPHWIVLDKSLRDS